MCAIINAQYQFSCAPRLARKCEIEHWCACGADGRAGGVRWPYGAPPTRASRAWSAAKNENASMVLLQNTLTHAASCLVIGWVQSQTKLDLAERYWKQFFEQFFRRSHLRVSAETKFKTKHCTVRQHKNNSFIWNIQRTRLDIPALWKSEADSFQYKFIIWTSWSSTRGAKENAWTASHHRSNPAFKASKPQEMLQEIGQPRDLNVKPA